MILAAGLGTRLRPLTDDRPKALVKVAERTLLEIAIQRLKAFGVDELIVNVHHYAGMICDFLEANHNFGIRIEVSREDALLDTGGGLKKASWFFEEPGVDRGQPFLLHNVDVMSAIDLGAMLRFHREQGALATLAIQDRKTSRGLVFDSTGQLCGRAVGGLETGLRVLGFAGIHVLSPAVFEELKEVGAFSIVDAYLRLAAEGKSIVGFDVGDSFWRDLGTPERVMQAAEDIGKARSAHQ
jgi:NDP-sugar pyrophosphorylase family protein